VEARWLQLVLAVLWCNARQSFVQYLQALRLCMQATISFLDYKVYNTI